MYKDILYEVHGPAAAVRLNRLASPNAFTQLMLAEVRHALGAAEPDEDVVGAPLQAD